MRLKFGRSFLENRRHHPTRAAPSRPKINQQGQITLVQMLGEALLAQGNGLRAEERLRARAALPAST
jgi:hypothetical protein